MMSKTTYAALALGFASLAIPLAASAAPNVVVAQSYTVADSAQNATTDTTVIHSETGHLLRGEQVHYSVVATNQGDRPAYAVVAMERIPRGSRLMLATLSKHAQISTDNGLTWMNASQNRMPAGRVNAVRWVLSRPLAVGANASFAYDVTVD